jgi:hypothetical protein
MLFRKAADAGDRVAQFNHALLLWRHAESESEAVHVAADQNLACAQLN